MGVVRGFTCMCVLFHFLLEKHLKPLRALIRSFFDNISFFSNLINLELLKQLSYPNNYPKSAVYYSDFKSYIHFLKTVHN